MKSKFYILHSTFYIIVFYILHFALYISHAQTLSSTNLYLVRGDSKVFEFNFYGNVTTDELLFVVKKDTAISSDRLIQKKNILAGGDTNQVTASYKKPFTKIKIKFYPIDTEDLLRNKYVFDLTRTDPVDSTDHTHLFIGYLNLQPTISTPGDGSTVPLDGTRFYFAGLDSSKENPGILINTDSTNEATWISVDSTKNLLNLPDNTQSNINGLLTKTLPFTNIMEFGANADGSTSDKTAFQSGIAATNHLYLPSGIFAIDTTITLINKDGLIIEGEDVGRNSGMGTILLWTGSDDIDMFKIIGGQRITLKNIKITTGTLKPLGCAIRFESNMGRGSTRNILENVIITGKAGALIDTCVALTSYLGNNNNNDLFEFKNVEFSNFRDIGVYIGHSQSALHSFYHCSIEGNALGNNSYGLYSVGGASFYWYGGSASFNTASDFYVSGSNYPICIQNFLSEGSGRFLETPVKPYSLGISVLNVSFNSPNINADKRIISVTNRSLELYGFRNLRTDDSVVVYFTSTPNGNNLFSVKDCSFGTTAANPFAGQEPSILLNSNRISGSTLTLLPNRITYLEGLKGNSDLSTVPKNLCGTAVMNANDSIAVITFVNAEPNNQYRIISSVSISVGGSQPPDGAYISYVTSPTTSGFNILLRRKPGASNTARVNWLLIRE